MIITKLYRLLSKKDKGGNPLINPNFVSKQKKPVEMLSIFPKFSSSCIKTLKCNHTTSRAFKIHSHTCQKKKKNHSHANYEEGEEEEILPQATLKTSTSLFP